MAFFFNTTAHGFRDEGTKWTIKGRVTMRGSMWKAWHPSISRQFLFFFTWIEPRRDFKQRNGGEGKAGKNSCKSRWTLWRRVIFFWQAIRLLKENICYVVVIRHLKRYLSAEQFKSTNVILESCVLNPVGFWLCELWTTCWIAEGLPCGTVGCRRWWDPSKLLQRSSREAVQCDGGIFFVKRCIGAHAFFLKGGLKMQNWENW